MYLYVAALTVIGTHFVTSRIKISARAFLLPDALGLAFSRSGNPEDARVSGKHPDRGGHGRRHGVFGGVVRDVLCNEVPVVFRGELYATAALSGAVLFAVLVN